MTEDTSSISEDELTELSKRYPKEGKNWDIGEFAVEIAKKYFISKNPTIKFIKKNGIDLSVDINGIVEDHEIKGIEKNHIFWNGIRVSSKNCYNKLVNGMILIRISNIRSINMTFHFLKYDEDFEIHEEPRWSIRKISTKN